MVQPLKPSGETSTRYLLQPLPVHSSVTVCTEAVLTTAEVGGSAKVYLSSEPSAPSPVLLKARTTRWYLVLRTRLLSMK